MHDMCIPNGVTHTWERQGSSMKEKRIQEYWHKWSKKYGRMLHITPCAELTAKALAR